ncbi:MAG: DNA helicase RecQ [Rhodothermales bacterium]
MPREPRALLKSIFGYDTFRPKQEEIVHRVVGGRDALVVMPTGGGKSICYQLPALVRPGVAIVVSPLISLMQDQIDALLQLGIRAAALNSGLSRADQEAVQQRLHAGELDLLYVAPERLMTPTFLGRLDALDVGLLAIDEAHCISQWGHDFRPEYLELASVRQRLSGVPCIAVTATADEPTQQDILQRLQMDVDDLFVTGFDRPNIRFTVDLKRNTRQQLKRFLQKRDHQDAGIIYCLSRKKVDQTAAWLNEQGFSAVPYHAGLSSADREAHQQRFLREEGLVVVATVAFGMGIDKPNVRFVAHLDVPKNLEGYYQEVGRAGRDGLPADAWMLYGLSDVVLLSKFIENSEGDDRHKWALRHKLNAITGYCETPECRRQVLLNYFGDRVDGPCGNCDNCLEPVETFDGTTAAQKVLSCAYRTGQRFGSAHLVDVLRGKATTKIERHGHDELPTFGVGSNRSATEWRSIVRQLVAADLLSVDVTGYGSLRLTRASGPVLKGDRTVRLREDPSPTKKSRKSTRTSKSTDDLLPDTPEGKALFERLRELRLALARDQEVPPYVIFHDRTLAAMARTRPLDLNAFADLPGVGEVKLERYGARFLDELRGFAVETAVETSLDS